jgi:hypothetical protein
MLILSLIYDFDTLQVDYKIAFTQADIDNPPNWDSTTKKEKERSGVYLEMPKGFKYQVKVLRLKKSLYGLRQSPMKLLIRLKEIFGEGGLIQTKRT